MVIHPDHYASLLASFDPFCCHGCGCRNGAAHRQGCPALPAIDRVNALLAEQDRVLAEMERAERERPKAILFVDDDGTFRELPPTSSPT